MYTSGTSGDPKGVVLTHEAVATFVVGVDLFMDQFEDKVTKESSLTKKKVNARTFMVDYIRF